MWNLIKEFIGGSSCPDPRKVIKVAIILIDTHETRQRDSLRIPNKGDELIGAQEQQKKT